MYGPVDAIYHACRLADDTCASASAAYDTGALRFASWYLSRSIVLAAVTHVLFKTFYARSIARWVIQLAILIATVEHSHSIYHGDLLIGGVYVGLWVASLLFGTAPRVRFGRLAAAACVAGVCVVVQYEAEHDRQGYSHDLHGVAQLAAAAAVALVVSSTALDRNAEKKGSRP